MTSSVVTNAVRARQLQMEKYSRTMPERGWSLLRVWLLEEVDGNVENKVASIVGDRSDTSVMSQHRM